MLPNLVCILHIAKPPRFYAIIFPNKVYLCVLNVFIYNIYLHLNHVIKGLNVLCSSFVFRAVPSFRNPHFIISTICLSSSTDLVVLSWFSTCILVLRTKERILYNTLTSNLYFVVDVQQEFCWLFTILNESYNTTKKEYNFCMHRNYKKEKLKHKLVSDIKVPEVIYSDPTDIYCKTKKIYNLVFVNTGKRTKILYL